MKHCKKCGESDQAKFYETSQFCRVCHREWMRDSRLRKRGVSRDEYLFKLHQQVGACAVCSRPESAVKDGHRGLHQDHNHKTGKVRGILCSRCNQVLGRVHEDVALLRSLADYLDAHA